MHSCSPRTRVAASEIRPGCLRKHIHFVSFCVLQRHPVWLAVLIQTKEFCLAGGKGELEEKAQAAPSAGWLAWLKRHKHLASAPSIKARIVSSAIFRASEAGEPHPRAAKTVNKLQLCI